MDSRDLAAFRRFIDDGFQQLVQNLACIEQSHATLARAYERLARERTPARPRPQHSGCASPVASGPGQLRAGGLALGGDNGDTGSKSWSA